MQIDLQLRGPTKKPQIKTERSKRLPEGRMRNDQTNKTKEKRKEGRLEGHPEGEENIGKANRCWKSAQRGGNKRQESRNDNGQEDAG